MPKVIKFRKGSVVYLAGETRFNDIYLLKYGKVLKETQLLGSQISRQEIVDRGEFFGIRSGVLGVPKEETIQAYTDCQVYVFTPSEFDLILKKNVSLIIKILIAFSNDLRRIHKVIEKKIGIKDNDKAEKKMLDIANYYQKVKKYKFALYIYKQYLVSFPDSVNRDNVKALIEKLLKLAKND